MRSLPPTTGAGWRPGSRRPRPAPALLLAALALALAPAAARAQVTATRVASGLASPVFVAAPMADRRLFAVERGGAIRIVEQGQVRATPFLDISDRVSTDGERGLLGLAFAEDFYDSGIFYVYYTDLAGDSRVSRFRTGSDPDVADPTEEPILAIAQPRSNHNGGTIAFGPDGMLYLAPGDGGGANDPGERAQDPAQLLGKMLRIDPGPEFREGSTPVPGTGYAVPADNPFVGVAGVRDEIWALGLRNPYRFSFDIGTGDLWIADVGQGAREEIDFEPAGDPGGRNWGWDVMEGSLCNPNDPAPAPPCGDSSLSLPLYEYDHGGGNCSITGGSVARHGPPEWRGQYVYGDFCTGRIWTLDPATATPTEWTSALGPAGGRAFELVGFGQDGLGRIHVVLSGGEVYRVEPRTACNNGRDDDRDGQVDTADPGCARSTSPLEAPACDNGVDDDGDGAVDLADDGCLGEPARNRETPGRCGLGGEVALVLLPLAARRARRARAVR